MAINVLKNKELYDDDSLLDIKTDELVLLLKNGSLDTDHLKAVQDKINDAITVSKSLSVPKKIEAFRELDNDLSRLDMVNDLEFLLSHHQLDSKVAKKYLLQEKLKKGILIAIAITMITLGMGMIIMPAPPYFEMFTIYYFNQNDGITLMDVISLLIVLTGVYLFLNAALKKSNT